MAQRPKMDAWRRRFVRNITFFALAVQAPFATWVWLSLTHAHVPLPALLAGLIVAAVQAPFLHRVTHWVEDHRLHSARVWLAEVPYFVHAVACLLSGPFGWLAMLVAFALRAIGHAPVFDLRVVLGGMYGAALVVSAYASFVRRFWTPVRTVEVPIENLPAALEGFSLVQLSDLHCGPFLPRWFYRSLAQRATALAPDVIVLTGDMITHGRGYLDDVTELVASLSARVGVFASLGNHDYFGAGDEVGAAMRLGGATVLRNGGMQIDTTRGGGVHLAAIDDTWSKRDDLAQSLSARPIGTPCVLLAHDPAVFPAVAARNEVDLMLSGHTHAGQFALPFFVRHVNLARLRYAFTAGGYRRGRTLLYVHAGNGTSGPPARIGAAPEIARFVLRRA